MRNILKLLKAKQAQTLEDRINIIQEGDEKEKNKLIQEYIPFIQKNISQQVGKYIDINNDDLYSVGLMAFNEAINKYNQEKGSFLSFASMVIKSRVIDQLRKESKRSKEVYISQFSSEVDGADYLMATEGFENKLEIKMDMKTLLQRMETFGVTLDDLIKEAPKHVDTRVNAVKIGRYVYENKGLRAKFMKTNNLPVGDLIKDLDVSKKVLQRSRKFIIAVILILDSNLDTMKSYISQTEGREHCEG
ncbi:RNA polymerase sigma-I factor [Alkaliphilus hydrothermalis]|uniref:RNA polymerase sigma factor SigI n=1 Tax=Alkaliphilus hydrothermalis TaxID=1482730 RepID=A0ABS2NPA7_9FIRM|nr:RNA polymerase sigma factor [Alkaliphilus hydrothermalis]